MKFDILTLFPEMFEPIKQSIIGRATKENIIEINLVNIRDFSFYKHKKVDDTPYGGGAGMLMRADVVYDCYSSVKSEESKVIYLSPKGNRLNQAKVEELAKEEHIIVLCGHYEGIDQRVIDKIVDEEISIGDYVLTGGELPSMVITDSIVRLLDGVIKEESHVEDSFHNNLLDYPVYTKPVDFRGMKVPEILLSGHHANIEKWRYEEQLKRTKLRRPDLLERDD